MDLTSAHLFKVSWHVDQTFVVWSLVESGAVAIQEFHNLLHPVTGQDVPVYEWHLFTELRGEDYRALLEAGFPLLNSRLGTWVGFTDRDPGYDDVIHPKLLKVLFGIEATGSQIRSMRKVRPVVGTVSNRVAEVVGTE